MVIIDIWAAGERKIPTPPPKQPLTPAPPKHQLALASLLSKMGGKSVDLIVSGHCYSWQLIARGPETTESLPFSHTYRGYLQVDPEQMPQAVECLSELARQREAQGKSTEFKFCFCNFSLANSGFMRMYRAEIETKQQLSANIVGHYDNRQADRPLIALYGRDLAQILEILDGLSRSPAWARIEAERSSNARREGSNAYIDRNGREWRSLCFNRQPGCAEDFIAQHPDWRAAVQGKATSQISVAPSPVQISRIITIGPTEDR
jgi:hypothetical protein